jgi:hypothetical protein
MCSSISFAFQIRLIDCLLHQIPLKLHSGVLGQLQSYKEGEIDWENMQKTKKGNVLIGIK